MALDLTIYVGTMTGTAELVAEEIRDFVEGEGGRARIVLMEELDAGAFSEGGLHFIVTSTYGQGDVPDNAQAFHDALTAERPDLSHVRYGLIGLGDSTYQQTFAFGGRKFDRLLTELGATRLGAAFYHDASGGDLPEEVGLDWFKDWAGAASGALMQAA